MTIRRKTKDSNKPAVLYLITHTASGKNYVGISTQHKRRWRDHVRDALAGSTVSPKLYAAIRKYGKEAFKFEVIGQASSWQESCQLERKAREEGLGDAYNCTMGGDGNLGHSPSPEIRERVRQKLLGVKHSEQRRKNIRDAIRLVARKKTEAERLAMSIAFRGIPKSEEHKKKTGDANRGRIHTAQSRENMRQAHLGKKPSAETLSKLSAIRKGKKKSPETKAKMSASAKKREFRRKVKRAVLKWERDND